MSFPTIGPAGRSVFLRRSAALATAVALTLGAAGTGAWAAPPRVGTHVDAACASLRGYLTDADPKGTNVRSRPSVDAPVVTRIPAAMAMTAGDPHAESVTASVRVIGSHGGWLLIRDVSLGDGLKNRFAWTGPGWVSGGLVGFTIGSLVLHTAPSTKSPVRAKLSGSNYGPDGFRVVRTYGCRGRWADVQLTSANPGSRGPLRGWVGAVCDTQLTTCDNIDLPEGADAGSP